MELQHKLMLLTQPDPKTVKPADVYERSAHEQEIVSVQNQFAFNDRFFTTGVKDPLVARRGVCVCGCVLNSAEMSSS